mgnify:CR=1 FL=1
MQDRIASTELYVEKSYTDSGIATLRPYVRIRQNEGADTIVDSGITFSYDPGRAAWYMQRGLRHGCGDLAPERVERKRVKIHLERFFRYYSRQDLLHPDYIEGVENLADYCWNYGKPDPEKERELQNDIRARRKSWD